MSLIEDGDIMEEKEMNLMSIDEYLELKGKDDTKVKKIPDKWLRITAGILMIVSGIISFKYCSIFLTFMNVESFGYEMCWLAFQIVFTLPTFIGVIAVFTRRKFQYAMIGAALSIMATIVLGAISIILLVMAQDEFEKYEEYDD